MFPRTVRYKYITLIKGNYTRRRAHAIFTQVYFEILDSVFWCCVI